MTTQQTRDVILALATFRSFNEQLYNLKGVHAGLLKKKFNRLIGTARQYEKEILRDLDNDKQIEEVYDLLTEVIYSVK